jgi:hypothetical protein
VELRIAALDGPVFRDRTYAIVCGVPEQHRAGESRRSDVPYRATTARKIVIRADSACRSCPEAAHDAPAGCSLLFVPCAPLRTIARARPETAGHASCNESAR